MISVSVAVLQIENNIFLFSHNKINPHTYLLLQQELQSMSQLQRFISKILIIECINPMRGRK